MDETGNSGQNLLDPGQPIFALAGVHLKDETAADIVAEVCSRLPATQGEPKYGSLAKATRGREALLWAFAQLSVGSVRAMPVHKPFMVMTKMVDLLMEPLAAVTGFNLYEGQQHLALADMMHVCGTAGLGDKAAYDRMLLTFVDWVRQRTSTDDLFGAIEAFRQTVKHEGMAGFFEMLEHCRPFADEMASEIASGETRDVLDPAVPVLYRLCLNFGASIGRFRVVHDSSKVVHQWVVPLRTAHLFPDPANPGGFMQQLPVSQINFADSKAHPQLQLADWAAGALRQWAADKAAGGGDPFAERLEPLVEPWKIDMIWPPSLNGGAGASTSGAGA
ncbi:hypothetical protein GCM10009801_08660 [Streptomyces albiaxialis]|uniref:DUF3800 domain-containing protein n=1 Tax=Streptomyces albiaxialis TaxID=329523 RepID=A0ABP5H646_9ACTN